MATLLHASLGLLIAAVAAVLVTWTLAVACEDDERLAASIYDRRMDLVRLFFLLTFPISQLVAWWEGEPVVWGRRR